MYANRNRNLTETVVHTSHLMPCARLLPPLQKECFGSSFATPCPFLHQRNRLISMDQSKKCEPAFFFLRVCGFAFFFLTLSHLRLHFCKPSFCEQQDWRSSLPHRFFFPFVFSFAFSGCSLSLFFYTQGPPILTKDPNASFKFFFSFIAEWCCVYFNMLNEHDFHVSLTMLHRTTGFLAFFSNVVSSFPFFFPISYQLYDCI